VESKIIRHFKNEFMAKTITQKLLFKNTRPAQLYNLYLDAKLHSLIAGSPVKISKKPGAPFSAHGGYITGENLFVIKDQLINQTWKAQGWKPEDGNSIFIIHLEKKGKDSKLTAIHANIPDQAEESISKGWYDHYWNPWKQHLAGKPITRPTM
jgi:activator of HSP90 ATPase